MSLIGIRRTKTVCDVRPDIKSAERDGRSKKRNIFAKMLRGISKLRKGKSSLSKAGSSINIENESKADTSGVYELPGTSFGDAHTHNHGSDSASTGYVSEGSSRRTTNPKQCLVDLERENKLAKRAHAQRFRPESEFIARSQSVSHVRRASDTDLDRDETDLETDEDRDSEVHSEESDEDSFYTSDCSTSSYVTDDDSARGAAKRYSQPVALSLRQTRELQAAARRQNATKSRHVPRDIFAKTSSSKPPSIARTMSARDFHYYDRDPIVPAPSAPSPALRARILRLEMGEQIDTKCSRQSKQTKSLPKSEDSSPAMSQRGSDGQSAVKKIASKFLQNTENTEPVLAKSADLKRTYSTNSNARSRPVLEKFAPKNIECDEKKEDDLSKPVGIRRTQSTKILDLAANLFQPASEIPTTSKPNSPKEFKTRPDTVQMSPRKLPSRSQTCKMTSPTAIGKRRQSSDSFIRELLEMAKVEVNLGEEKPKKINDFKSQICQASTKITRRKTLKEDDLEKPISCLRQTKSTAMPGHNGQVSTATNGQQKVEELDPFVKEILNSDSVPKAVKNKIKEECWSLFNDPRTPKGVKQCILNTMLTKTHSE